MNIPRLNDRVTVEGVDGVLVVVGVDSRKQIAKVTTRMFLYIVPWSKLSYFEESQNEASPLSG
jgi:hypothetical protein